MTRYRSAFCSAAGTPSGEIALQVVLFGHASSFRLNTLSSRPSGIEELVHHPLLERDDRVVGDGDVLGADLRAALGDVAEPDAVRPPEIGHAVLGVERVHLERRGVHEEARADELLVQLVVAQHVADVLAEEALDALPELLHALDVALVHAPGAVGGIGRARLERLDGRLDAEVPRDVGDEVAHVRKGAHRLDGHRLVRRQLVEPRHAHQLRLAVDLGRARAALPRLAVPAHREIVGLLRLDLVHRVEHDHPRRRPACGSPGIARPSRRRARPGR